MTNPRNMLNANWLSPPRLRTNRIKSHGFPLRDAKLVAGCWLSLVASIELRRSVPPSFSEIRRSRSAIVATRSEMPSVGRTVAYSTTSMDNSFDSGSAGSVRRNFAHTSGNDEPSTCHASHANDSTANWYSPTHSAVYSGSVTSAVTPAVTSTHSREVDSAVDARRVAPSVDASLATAAKRAAASLSPPRAAWNATHASTASVAIRGLSSLVSENRSAACASGNESMDSISATCAKSSSSLRSMSATSRLGSSSFGSVDASVRRPLATSSRRAHCAPTVLAQSVSADPFMA